MFGLAPSVTACAALALIVSLVTLVVGWRSWRGEAQTVGPGLEVLCCVVNAAALLFAYHHVFSVGLAARGPTLSRVGLAVSVLLERFGSLMPLTVLLPSLAAIAIALSWAGRMRLVQATPRVGWLVVAVVLFLGSIGAFVSGFSAYTASTTQPTAWQDRVAAAEEARYSLRRGAMVASLAVLAAALAVLQSRRTRRTQSHWAFTVVPTLLFGGGAAALFWYGRSLAAENARPVSMSYAYANTSLSVTPSAGMSGVGPDELVEAPLVLLRGDAIELDGQALKGGVELREGLRRRRALWQDMRKGEHHPGNVIVDASPDVPIKILAERLAHIRDSGHPNLRFRLTDSHTDVRPVLGTIVGSSFSAALVTLATMLGDCGAAPFEVVRLTSRWRSSKELVDAVVAERRAQKRVCVIPAGPHCRGDLADCFSRDFEVIRYAASMDALRARLDGGELDFVFLRGDTRLELLGRGTALAEVQKRTFAFNAPGAEAVRPWTRTENQIDALTFMRVASGPTLLETTTVIPEADDDKAMRTGAGLDADRQLVVFTFSTVPVTRHALATALLAVGCDEAIELAKGTLWVQLPALERTPQAQAFASGPFLALPSHE